MMQVAVIHQLHQYASWREADASNARASG